MGFCIKFKPGILGGLKKIVCTHVPSEAHQAMYLLTLEGYLAREVAKAFALARHFVLLLRDKDLFPTSCPAKGMSEI